ncbi:MAG: hypothetical protein R3F59_14520 [Myxococcota bacterium]
MVRKGWTGCRSLREQPAWLTTEHKLTFVVDRHAQQFLVDAPPARAGGSNSTRSGSSGSTGSTWRTWTASRGSARWRRGRLAVKLAPDAGEEVLVSQERAPALAWLAR